VSLEEVINKQQKNKNADAAPNGRTQSFLLHSGKKISGKEKGLNKKQVFEKIVSLEAKKRTLDELNKIFDRKLFPGYYKGFAYIISEQQCSKLSENMRRKYIPIDTKSKDGKSLCVTNQWGNTESATKPGNFPVLIELAKELGYKIIEKQK